MTNDQPRKLTPEEQRISDEAMVFELAACMMDLYTAILTRNPKGTTSVVVRVGELLKRDATFLMRFRNARVAVAAEQDKQAKARTILT